MGKWADLILHFQPWAFQSIIQIMPLSLLPAPPITHADGYVIMKWAMGPYKSKTHCSQIGNTKHKVCENAFFFFFFLKQIKKEVFFLALLLKRTCCYSESGHALTPVSITGLSLLCGNTFTCCSFSCGRCQKEGSVSVSPLTLQVLQR